MNYVLPIFINMQTSAKRLLETIIREELSLLRENNDPTQPTDEEKKKIVDKLKEMFRCVYDSLYKESNKGGVEGSGVLTPSAQKKLDIDKKAETASIDFIYTKLRSTKMYNDENYNIPCTNIKGNVYQLVKQASDKQSAETTATDKAKAEAKFISDNNLDPNYIVTQFPIAKKGSETEWRLKSSGLGGLRTERLISTLMANIKSFPDRKSIKGLISLLKMWTGPGGVSAGKMINELKEIFNWYDPEQLNKYYDYRDGYILFRGFQMNRPPKLKKDKKAARNNFMKVAKRTMEYNYSGNGKSLVQLIKSKTSLRERLGVAKWIVDNILEDPSDWWILDDLFDKNDQIDVLQVFSARSSSVKDLSDMGGPVDAEDQEAYYKFFANRYKDQKKEYERSWAAMQKDPWSEKGRAHLYKYNMFRGYDENRHTYNLIAGILGGMIPFVGPVIGGTIFSADADQYFQEGDTINGTISGVFALLPFVPAIVRLIPGIGELGAKGMFNLSQKMSKLTSNSYVLTKLEEQVLQGLRKYEAIIGPELQKAISANAKKYIYNVHNKFLGTPLSYSPTLMKIASWAASGSYKFGKLIATFGPYLAIGPTASALSVTDWWQRWQASIDEEDYMEEFDKALKDEKYNEKQRKEYRDQLKQADEKRAAEEEEELKKSMDSRFKTF